MLVLFFLLFTGSEIPSESKAEEKKTEEKPAEVAKGKKDKKKKGDSDDEWVWGKIEVTDWESNLCFVCKLNALLKLAI